MTQDRTTLTEMLAEVVSRDPEAPAIIDDTADALTMSYGDLWRRVLAVRDDLRDRGVGPGDCIGVYLPNWADSIVWQFAVAALGAHVIGINTRYGVGDIAHLLERSRPCVVAVAHNFRDLPFGDRLREALSQVDAPAPAVAVISPPGESVATTDIVAGHDLGSGAWAPAEVDLSGPLDLHALDGAPDTLSVAFTTSGSTGQPKLAAHRSSNVAHHARGVAALANLGPQSRTLLPLPLSGVLSFNPAYAALAAGGALVMQPAFDGAHALNLMERHAVTHMTAADDIGAAVKAAWEKEPRDLSAFERFLFGDFYGKSAEVAEWVETHTSGTAASIFGSSEVFALLTFWPASEGDEARLSIGGGQAASDATELRIIDPVTREVLPAGESGELEVRGYAVVDAYLGDDDGSLLAKNVDADGWFHTGDLCRLREDGALLYQCRMGDSLRLKGFLVEPIEIESVIAQLAEVAMVKAVGIQGDGETRLVAFVTAIPGSHLDGDSVRQYCLDRLARYKVPEYVNVIDEMPTTRGANGTKVRAAALRDLASELHSTPSKGTK